MAVRTPPAALLDFNLSPVLPLSCGVVFQTLLTAAQGPEHIVITVGGLVIANVGHQVHAHGSAGDDVDAAALPEAGAARAPGSTAVSAVVDDRALNDGERGGSAVQGIRRPIPDAAALTVAAVAPTPPAPPLAWFSTSDV